MAVATKPKEAEAYRAGYDEGKRFFERREATGVSALDLFLTLVSPTYGAGKLGAAGAKAIVEFIRSNDGREFMKKIDRINSNYKTLAQWAEAVVKAVNETVKDPLTRKILLEIARAACPAILLGEESAKGVQKALEDAGKSSLLRTTPFRR